MEQHKGKIVEEAIKKSGYRMKALAKKLGIARNTLYIRLKEAALKDAFIIAIGNIIHYDFSNDFPDLYKKDKDQDQPERSDDAQGYKPREDPSKPHHDPRGMYVSYRDPYFLQLQKLSGKYLKLMEGYNKLLKILILLANSNELVGIKKEIMEFLEDEEKDD